MTERGCGGSVVVARALRHCLCVTLMNNGCGFCDKGPSHETEECYVDVAGE